MAVDDWDRFRSDNEVVWTIQDMGGLSQNVRAAGERLLTRNADLRSLIEAELEARW